ncbi:3-dehydroquinate synthase [SAR86 cluster bacterium SAR86E]|uniref:3-dehydroquinate synthase n=1 Tax=SAR86 cluster bacterium SAR86E TaxID=1208365 RepID=K6G4T9_9GAMM|nr:3-dehydroquinate synthase [SAR86 cluster bacterium SAR86E]
MASELFAGNQSERYKIVIGKKTLSKKFILPLIKCHGKVMIISDDGIPKKITNQISAICKEKTKVFKTILKKGEASKSIENFKKILNTLIEKKFDRSDLIIALGGGVVGDISGYVASSYLRGISFIQIPTTLLAQVDSSVGGKTAINIPAGKNLVGAFYNPKGVIIDTDTLKSLPEREFKSGLAEVLKYGLIQNKYLLSLLQENSAEVLLRRERIIQEIIFESIKTKSKIVIADEKENGLRAILNFGHTFGHAIEANGKYKKILHGEAVAKGMLIASKISYLENLIPLKDLEKIELLLKDFKFDLSLDEYQYSDLKPYIYRDKKVKAGKLNLILLEKISKAKITNTFNPKNLSKAFAI